MAAEEVIDDVVETVARTVPLHMSLIGAAMTFAGGCLIGYAYTERKLRVQYAALAEEEIDSMREHFRSKEIAREEKPAVETIVAEQGYVAAPIPQPEKPVGKTLQERIDHAKAEGAEAEAVLDDEVESRRENVFEQAVVEDEWDYEEEVRMRRPDYPYIIHVDEVGEVPELDQLSWTYWEGDEILVNASGDVVTDVERCVGLSNLDKFGHGSGDANIVLIRNVVLGIEIEIIKSSGKYEEEVLGLKHADENIRRRKRSFDDDGG